MNTPQPLRFASPNVAACENGRRHTRVRCRLGCSHSVRRSRGRARALSRNKAQPRYGSPCSRAAPCGGARRRSGARRPAHVCRAVRWRDAGQAALPRCTRRDTPRAEAQVAV
jgi:hypothetical protein